MRRRRCSVCKKRRPVVAFHQNGKYRRTYCTRCQNEKHYDWRARRASIEPRAKYVCQKCGRSFSRRPSLHERNLKRSGATYCGPRCIPKKGRCLNELSPFRKLATQVRARHYTRVRYGPSDLTASFLKALWDEQGGRCVLTGWLMKLPLGGRHPSGDRSRVNASIDRIDGKYGYVQGNVRLVALAVNLARNQWSDSDLIELCTAVVQHHEVEARHES